MAIKSSGSKPTNEKEILRTITPLETEADTGNETTLRPKTMNEYVGQGAIKKHLRIAIDSARIRKTALDHVLFYGPPGLGKTTLSVIIANEMNATIKHTSGPAIEKQSDLISILTSLQEWDVLFIDEIHRLKSQIEEILYSAMEDYTIDIMLGSGTWATSIKMDIPRFTLIGATTKLSSLSSPLRDRFGNVLKLDFYDTPDLAKIITRSFSILGNPLKNNTIAEWIAKRSRGTPRIANRFVKMIRDYAIVGHDISTPKAINEIFESFGIDDFGLDMLDRKILESMVHSFGSKPVGLNTLASIIGEEEQTIEDVVEPYLLKLGFIERTPRGRQITMSGEKYIQNISQK